MGKKQLKWWGLFYVLLAFSAVMAQEEAPVSEKEVRELKANEEDLWYADLPLPALPEQKKGSPTEPLKIPAWVGGLFKTLMWSVIAAVLIYIVYVIVQQIKLNRETVNEVIEDDVEIASHEDLQRINFQQSIQQALEKGNYRLSIRFYYLWIIQQLSDDGLITFTKDKTNQTYVRELTQNNKVSPNLAASFKTCTRLYEYVWFGNFDVDKNRFEEIEPNFSFILNQVAR